MSKIDESLTNSIDRKSSNVVIISKGRIESAKNRINFITLKEGELKLTTQMMEESLDKNLIDKEVSNLKQQILINSQSNDMLYKNDNLKTYLQKKDIIKLSTKKIRNSIKKNETINFETTRNLIKNSENDKYNIDENYEEKNIETMVVNDKNIFKKIKINKKIIQKKTNFNDITGIQIKEENNGDSNNLNNNIDIHDNVLVPNNYFINLKKNKLYKKDKIEKQKSEEMKINSYSSKGKETDILKNNNFIEKNNQQSNIAAKSINDQDSDKQTKIVSKLILDPFLTNIVENKDNYISQRLITENESDSESIKYSEKDKVKFSSENKSIRTIKIDEDDDSEEKNKNIKNNKISNNEDNLNNNKNKNEKNELEEDKKEYLKIRNAFEDDNKEKIMRKLRTAQNFKEKKANIVYKMCSICERGFPLTRMFLPECEKHFFCRKCAKNYYEDIIENGIKEMLCPFMKCRQPIDFEDLKNIISKEHFDLLCNDKKLIDEGQKKYYLTKIKTNIDKKNMELYTKRNVIDINSNKGFFNYNNAKGVYCPNCFKESLFSKTNTHFFKCLNCGCKKCKYCLKNFEETHMDINTVNHCKVYYRFEEDENKKNKLFLNFLIQIFFVFASFYLCFAGAFLLIKKFFLFLFRVKINESIILYMLAYFFTIIFFIISIPFIEIFYPFFPNIMALTDY